MNISQLTDILQIDAYLRLYVFAYSFTDIMLVWIEVWRVSTHINGKTKKKKLLKNVPIRNHGHLSSMAF